MLQWQIVLFSDGDMMDNVFIDNVFIERNVMIVY